MLHRGTTTSPTAAKELEASSPRRERMHSSATKLSSWPGVNCARTQCTRAVVDARAVAKRLCKVYHHLFDVVRVRVDLRHEGGGGLGG